MIPAIWTSYLIDLEPEAAVDTLASKGWHELELSDEHAETVLKRGRPEVVGEAFRRYAADRGVTFPQGHLWLMSDIAALEQEPVLDGMRRWLDLFVALGIRAAVLHPGGGAMRQAGSTAEEVLAAQAHALRTLSDHLGDADLTLCLENIGEDADALLTIINTADCGHLGICLDTGHLNIHGGEQGHFIRTAGARLKALHIADNDTSSDQHLMPWGLGTVRWEEAMVALREIGYSGLVNLEIGGERRCPMPVRLAKLDYLKEVLRYMVEDLGR